MSEKQFTTVSMGREEAYCDFSIIKVGDKIISDGIPTTDAIGICDLLNELNEENDVLKQQLKTRYVVNKQYEELQRLREENKELKYKLRNCEDARKSYKQDWKACSSYCDEYKNEIISLKDEVEGLIGENKEFKKENEQLRKKLEQIYSFKGLNCRCVNGV